MSRACAPAAFDRWRLDLSGLSPRDVRSWLTRQSAAFASATVEVCAVGPSAEAQTVAAEAALAPAATATRRRRRSALLYEQVRIYLLYRVDDYPALARRHMY